MRQRRLTDELLLRWRDAFHAKRNDFRCYVSPTESVASLNRRRHGCFENSIAMMEKSVSRVGKSGSMLLCLVNDGCDLHTVLLANSFTRGLNITSICTQRFSKRRRRKKEWRPKKKNTSVYRSSKFCSARKRRCYEPRSLISFTILIVGNDEQFSPKFTWAIKSYSPFHPSSSFSVWGSLWWGKGFKWTVTI